MYTALFRAASGRVFRGIMLRMYGPARLYAEEMDDYAIPKYCCMPSKDSKST